LSNQFHQHAATSNAMVNVAALLLQKSAGFHD